MLVSRVAAQIRKSSALRADLFRRCAVERSRAALCCLLSLSLALSCCIPCYAYAEGGTAQEVATDAQVDRGHRSGNESSEGSGEQSGDKGIGEGAEPSYQTSQAQDVGTSQDTGSFFSDSGGSASAGLDGSTEDEYLYWSGGGDDSGADGLDYGDGGLDDSYGGNAADSSLSLESLGVSLLAGSFSVIDTLVATSWTGEGTQFVIGPYKLAVKNGTILWGVICIADYCESLYEQALAGNNYLKAIDTSNKDIRDAWGYGYGGTVVTYNNSPAGWLKRLYEYNYQQWGYDYNLGNGGAMYNGSPAWLLKKLYQYSYQQWGYDYGTGSYGLYNESPGGWLKSINDHLKRDWAWGWDYDANGGSYYNNSPAGWLRSIKTETDGLHNLINQFYKYNYQQWGYDYDNGQGGAFYGNSPAGWLNKLYRNTYEQWGWDYGLVTQGWRPDSPAAWLRSIMLGTDELSSMFMQDGYRFNFWNFSDIVERIRLLVSDSNDALLDSISLLEDINTNTNETQAQLDLLNLKVSNFDVDFLEWVADWWEVSVWTSNTNALLDEIKALLIDWPSDEVHLGDVSVSADMSGVEARLDHIADLLLIAGAKDMLDTLIGDFDLINPADIDKISNALSNALPFCIPAIFKQVLGLLQADPAPPHWSFDIMGAPLEFGFEDMQGFADITGWLCRIGFVILLLGNTRRFVFMGGAAYNA